MAFQIDAEALGRRPGGEKPGLPSSLLALRRFARDILNP
jgi:hypothetical protein